MPDAIDIAALDELLLLLRRHGVRKFNSFQLDIELGVLAAPATTRTSDQRVNEANERNYRK